jgi:hypothetical protein
MRNQPISVHKKYDHLIHMVFKQKNKWISLYRNCCVKLSHITYKNTCNKKLSICSKEKKNYQNCSLDNYMIVGKVVK